MSRSAGAERRSGSERRSGGDRRLRSHGTWLGTAAEPVPRDPEPVPLGRVLPHARFNESEAAERDRKSTRLNSSHGYISYAVFCLKKKKKIQITLKDGEQIHLDRLRYK